MASKPPVTDTHSDTHAGAQPGAAPATTPATTPGSTAGSSTDTNIKNFSDLPCCPDLDMQPVCDIVDFRRRLIFASKARGRDQQPIEVEVIIHTRFERCSGPLSLGDIAYSTTLLPGETVRLQTTDRRSRFSFDSETNLSTRSEQMSEEQYRLTAFRSLMSDANSTDNGRDSSQQQSKWDFHGDASGGIGFFSASADANARGSHNESSVSDYLREHRAHAESSDHQSVEATRKAHSVSVGEVSSRAHSEGQSEDHFESSSREFSNANHCHAVTYLFYRLNKTETVKFSLVAIERRVIDPAAPLPVPGVSQQSNGGLATVPQEVPATSKLRLETLRRSIDAEALQESVGANNLGFANRRAAAAGVSDVPPLDPAVRAAVLADVDDRLAAAGLIDRASGKPSDKIRQEIEYSRRTALPTAGVVVKGCLDKCSTCEPELERKINLELDRMELENQMLKRRIELLDKSREYQPDDDDDDTAALPAPAPAPAPQPVHA